MHMPDAHPARKRGIACHVVRATGFTHRSLAALF
jgi:hypothetical protein